MVLCAYDRDHIDKCEARIVNSEREAAQAKEQVSSQAVVAPATIALKQLVIGGFS